MIMKNTGVNLNALFLGPKSENEDFFLKELVRLFEDHAQWRKNYQPGDEEVIKTSFKNCETFIDTSEKCEEVLKELSRRLRAGATPWHSPRYLGHMNSETLMPGLLGYFGAMLYNLNNVAYESSQPTSIMEDEVGADLCKLLGFDPVKGWGHICCDGSIANFEGIWYARNLKSLPLAMKEVAPELVQGKDDWALMNMPIDQIIDLIENHENKWEILKAHSARAASKELPHLGKWIVPETKHYSWLKAADVLGIGTDNIVAIELNNNYRMDVEKLKVAIDQLVAEKTPILGVVAVVGTTEEGAVDYIDKIVALKEEYSKKGINFYFHVDAAYGGYARSIFLDEDYNFIEKSMLKEKYKEYDVFYNENINWPSDDIYNAFKAMSQADSITIDPHKMGYIPYAAGGIVIKDRRMRNSISYFASYVFEKGVEIPALLGAFIMEGSKAGATAAAVWAAHRVLPLNIAGYGKLIGASVEGAFNLYDYLKAKNSIKVGDKVIRVEPLTSPDFNMVDFIFNVEGNKSLESLNKLNHDLYDLSSVMTPNLYANEFVTSHTDFNINDYANSPLDVLQRLDIPKEEWFKVNDLTLLRACVLSPFLNNPETFKTYIEKVEESIIKKLTLIIK